MSNDISISCATLGSGYNAAVVAIGAQAFDITTGKLTDKYYREIAVSWALRVGEPDAAKIAWWIGQGAKARKLFERDDNEKGSNATVLLEFTKWVRDDHGNKGPLRVWTGGASMDTTWIERALAEGSHGISVPWLPSQVMDSCTIARLARDIAGFDQARIDHPGTVGHALDDAIDLANVISAAYAALGTGKKPATNVDDL